MTSKREERKLRSEAERLERERMKRANIMRKRFLLIAGVLAVVTVVFLGLTRRQDSGRVWSAEHGHWHDK